MATRHFLVICSSEKGRANSQFARFSRQTATEEPVQTASLPGSPERAHRRSQGKLPVCPTLAPRFLFLPCVATRHEGCLRYPLIGAGVTLHRSDITIRHRKTKGQEHSAHSRDLLAIGRDQ